MKKLTAILPATAICVILASCETGHKSVVLQFKYQPGTYLTYDQSTKEAFEVTEEGKVVKKGNTSVALTVEQTCRRVLPDSTAEVYEADKWIYTAPNDKDSTILDTIRESRDMVVYIKPNGRVVDLDFKSKIDSASAAYIEQFYAQGVPIFPSEPVTQGSKWTQTARVMIDSTPMEASTTYEIASFAREQDYDCVVLNYSGNLVLPIKRNPDDTSQRSGVNRVQSTGTMYVAYKEGQVVLQKEQWKIDGDRRRLKQGKFVDSRVKMTMETVFALKERKQT